VIIIGINVLSLFDGQSCGAEALKRTTHEVENYFASEIEDSAIEVAKRNHPYINPIGDINKLTEEELKSYPKIDLILAGSPCFPKGQKIITKEGFKSIEDIQKDDLVLTHKGRYRQVVTAMKRLYSGNLYSIRPTYYNFRIEATDEHPFYTQRGWVAAQDLKTDDYLSMPLNKEYVIPEQIRYEQKINKYKVIQKETNLPLDSEYFWKLIGYWLAEGWTRDKRNGKDSKNTYQVFLSSTEEKYKYISEVLKKLDIKYLLLKGKSCDKIRIGNKQLWLFVKQFTTGTKAYEKFIPEFVQDLPLNLAKAFVEGFKNGDGHENDGRIRFSSTSLSLLESLQRLLLKTEKMMYSLGQSHYERECTIEGRLVNARDSYYLEKIKSDCKFAYFTDEYVFYKVRNINIELVEGINVYNFEVEEDNSYCLPITAVHNCQGFSRNGKGLNFDDPRSSLFFKFIEVVKWVRENNNHDVKFLLENVVMKKEWESLIDEYTGQKSMLINSELLSAQKRPRLYWTNIEGVEQPKDRSINLKDILEENVSSEYDVPEHILKSEPVEFHDKDGNLLWRRERFIEIKGNQAIVRQATKLGYLIAEDGDSINLSLPNSKTRRGRVGKGKSNTLDTQCNQAVFIDGRVRYFTLTELERLQTLSDGYTEGIKDSARKKAIGNGWTVDVIAHILSYMK
jgi:site-specific DNA-cytosine methylase